MDRQKLEDAIAVRLLADRKGSRDEIKTALAKLSDEELQRMWDEDVSARARLPKHYLR
jgi:hypothetical protein